MSMEPLKNMYNRAFVDNLAQAIHGEYPLFDSAAFTQTVFDHEWENRELKERVRHISLSMHAHLPASYKEAVGILSRASSCLDQYTFECIIFPDFVEVYGLDDWETSSPALELFTQQCSSEFAVRSFILQDCERMMAQMLKWATHDSVHVRRLATEGCRPRLPWAVSLPMFKDDPTPILPILETLKFDSEEYVRKSVANNLNDIAKDNPDVTLDVTRRWAARDELSWIVKHALRTLLKVGDPASLEILGFSPTPRITVDNLTLKTPVVAIGDDLEFSFDITSMAESTQSLMIDYVVHFLRKKGTHSEKVFKLSQRDIHPGECITLTRKQSFRPVSTRKYYVGPHAVEIQVNGQRSAKIEFQLIEQG
jgi:3-methyladenine DNA glycosylase AlkC